MSRIRGTLGLAIGLFCAAGILLAEDRRDSNGGTVRLVRSPTGAPVASGDGSALAGMQVLLYTGFADSLSASSTLNVSSILSGAGATVVTTNTTDPNTLLAALSSADAFVIVEQFESSFHDHPDPGLNNLASAMLGFRRPVQEFLHVMGRPVIVLEGDLSTEPGEVVVDSLQQTSLDSLQETVGLAPGISIAAPGDALMAGVAGLTGVNGDQTFTTVDAALLPVAVLSSDPTQYVVARKGRFCVIGYDFYDHTAPLDQLLINACLL